MKPSRTSCGLPHHSPSACKVCHSLARQILKTNCGKTPGSAFSRAMGRALCRAEPLYRRSSRDKDPVGILGAPEPQEASAKRSTTHKQCPGLCNAPWRVQWAPKPQEASAKRSTTHKQCPG